jgi:hypothetical protein
MIRQGIYDDADRMYMMTRLEMGADRQEVQVILDSGSSATWINRYDCGNDPIGLLGDCRLASQPQSLGYLDGVISGKIAHTSVWLNAGSVESKNHDVVVIDQKTKLMTYGIVGLSKGYDNEPTFLGILKSNKLIPEEAFAIYCKDDMFELILGGVDRSLVKPNAKEAIVPISSEEAFFITVDSALVGDTFVSSTPTMALIDSGNTLISFPGYLARPVLAALTQRGIECILVQEQNPMFNILGCSIEDTASFPDFSFKINGVQFIIPGNFLTNQCEESGFGTGYAYDDEPQARACYMKIEFFMAENYFTLGKAFLQKIYTTFNLDKKTLTFVQNLD